MSIHDTALDCLARGWSTIPMRLDCDANGKARKRPADKWKPYQTQRPAPQQLEHWFGNGHDYGLGVIFGEVSGGLASRDFDVIESYNIWAATYPTLAAMLATVETQRGRHVYCRFAAADVKNFRAKLGKPDGKGAIDIGDGELRLGIGCYSVLPPSKLANGFEYRWLIRPTADSLPLLKLADTGFGVCYTEDTDNTGELRGLKTLRALKADPWKSATRVRPDRTVTANGALTTSLCPVSSAPSVLQKVELAIERTLPSNYGKRHQAVFQFGRHLKSIPELAGATIDQFKPYVRQWHKRALPNITSKPFEETWFDFVEGLDKVKHLVGEEPIAMAFAKAAAAELPECAQEYEQEELRLLVALCRELQRSARHQPFYLAGRSVSRLLGVEHWQAARWLRGLCHDRILVEVEKGSHAKHQASSYRYLQPL